MWDCRGLTYFCSASENDSKITKLPQENCDREEPTNSVEPSECKIAKTDLDDNDINALKPPGETIEVKVIYNKKKYDINASEDCTVTDFKKKLQELLGK